MRFLEKTSDGGPVSGVTCFFLIEIKSLFSIAIIRFTKGSREAFHNHAFNAWTFWIKGAVLETMLDGKQIVWLAPSLKYTPRTTFHRVNPAGNAWCISFRGPWAKNWNEVENNKFRTLENGRKVVSETEYH